jgi:hypothetical protein
MLCSKHIFLITPPLLPALHSLKLHGAQINIVYGLANFIFLIKVFANNVIFNNIILPSEADKGRDIRVPLFRQNCLYGVAQLNSHCLVA